MNLETRIYTWFFGKFVGSDEFGNKYYCNSKITDSLSAKRWVIFNGEVESSKVPPHWHAWLHKTVSKPPINYKHKYIWQKNHAPNMTGTLNAYHPNSDSLFKNDKKNSDYEKWNP